MILCNFVFAIVASQRKIYVLPVYATPHTAAGSLRTCPGSGTDTDTKTIAGVRAGQSPVFPPPLSHVNQKDQLEKDA